MEFNCSCMKMESFGIPCKHIIYVLVHEDIDKLSRSLVLPRWTKTCRGHQNYNPTHTNYSPFIHTSYTIYTIHQ
ncbi:hypothetical protein AHAS_Ahas05G0081600 [Arachis hypogaea]